MKYNTTFDLPTIFSCPVRSGPLPSSSGFTPTGDNNNKKKNNNNRLRTDSYHTHPAPLICVWDFDICYGYQIFNFLLLSGLTVLVGIGIKGVRLIILVREKVPKSSVKRTES